MAKKGRGLEINLDSWDPRMDVYSSDINSYDRGPGKSMKLQKINTEENEKTVQLYVSGIPIEMTQDGLRNLFLRAGCVLDVKKMPSKKPEEGHTYGFVTMGSIKDAISALEKLHMFKIGPKFMLKVEVAMSDSQRIQRHLMGKDDEHFCNWLHNQKNKPNWSSSDGESTKENLPLHSQTDRMIGAEKTEGESSENMTFKDHCGLQANLGGETLLSSIHGSSRLSAQGDTLEKRLDSVLKNSGGGRCQTSAKGYVTTTGFLDQVENLQVTVGNKSNLSRAVLSLDDKLDLRLNHTRWNLGSGFSQLSSGRDGTFMPNFGRGYVASQKKLPHCFELQNKNSSNHQWLTKVSDSKVDVRRQSNNSSGDEESKQRVSIRHCDRCQKTGRLQCSVCKVPYCSKECQKADWPNHQHLCKSLSANKKEMEELADRFDLFLTENEIINNCKALVQDYNQQQNKEFDLELCHAGNQNKMKEAECRMASSSPVADNDRQLSLLEIYDPEEPDHNIKQKEADNLTTGSDKQIGLAESSAEMYLAKDQPVVNLPQVAEILITELVSPEEIWVQVLTKENAEGMEALMMQVAQVYSADTDPVVRCPQLDELYACQFSVDKLWYRVRIQKKLPQSKFIVFYVDFGNQEVVTRDRLHVLKSSMVKLPSQAVCCGLNVKPCGERDGWDEEEMEQIKSLLQVNARYIARIEKVATPVIVKLWHPDDDKLDIGAQLINMNLAVSLVSSSRTRIFTNTVSAEPAHVVDSSISQLQVGFQPTTGYQQNPFLASLLGNVGEELEINKVYNVLVTDVTSPEDFMLQVLDQERIEKFKKFTREITNFVRRAPPLTHRPIVGELVLARFTVDENWYRGEVLDVHDDSLTVLYLDYGNKETISLNDVRKAEDFLLVYPAHAIQSRLANIQPSVEQWSEDSLNLFKTVIELAKKGLLGKLLKKQNGIFLWDLTEPISHTSIAKAFIEDGFARSTSTDVESDRNNKLGPLILSKDVPVVSVSKNQCVLAAVYEIKDFYCFYIQLLEEENKSSINTLMHDLNSYYNMKPQEEYSAEVGEFVAARFSQDKLCYRADVLEIGDAGYTVFFVDYGNSEVVARNEVYRLDQQFSKLPLQAIKCRLFCSNRCLNKKHLLDFARMVLNVSALFRIIEVVDGVAAVEITTNDGQCINTYFKSIISDFKGREIEKEQTLTEAASTVQRNQYWLKDAPQCILEVHTAYKVICTSVRDVTDFSCQLADKSALENLVFLLEKLNAKCNNSSACSSKLDVGEICCAKFRDDSWYRAVVEKHNSDGTVLVCYLDFGNSESVSTDSIQEMSAEFIGLPILAFRCCLAEISQQSWSSTRLKESQDSCLEFTVVSKKDDKYEVLMKDDVPEIVLHQQVSEERAISACSSQVETDTSGSLSSDERKKDLKKKILALQMELNQLE